MTKTITGNEKIAIVERESFDRWTFKILIQTEADGDQKMLQLSVMDPLAAEALQSLIDDAAAYRAMTARPALKVVQ